MYPPLCGLLLSIYLFSYCMKDLEGSKKFVFKLLIPLSFDVFAIQPDILARSIVTAFYFFLIGFFL